MDERQEEQREIENGMLSWSPEEDKLFAGHPSPASYQMLSLSFTVYFSPLSPSSTFLHAFVISLGVARL